MPPDDAIKAPSGNRADRNTQRGLTMPELLKRYRARHGWTQAQAAAAIGISLRTWQGRELGIGDDPILRWLLTEILDA